MIRVNELTKYFNDYKVLEDLSLHVRKGTIYGLVGPNGAGKTTLINHINGVLSSNKGEVLIDGEKVYENDEVKKHVLSISDEWFFYNTYTVKAMAKFYADMYPTFSWDRYEKIKKAFSIDENTQIRKFSKGMKKQVAFWLSISAMPEVLLLDEPLDGLDPVMRKQVLGLVIQDVIERNLTVLVSSHNLRELEDICDWVGIIHNGKMMAEKPLDDMKGNIHKYQIVIDPSLEETLKGIEGVVFVSRIGSIHNVIIKGNADETEEKLRKLSPRLLDHISLTLEEVFIYELGGLGYDYKNILI